MVGRTIHDDMINHDDLSVTFNLRLRDIITCTILKEVFLAVSNGQITVFRQITDVAGVQSAVLCEECATTIIPAEISHHHIGTPTKICPHWSISVEHYRVDAQRCQIGAVGRLTDTGRSLSTRSLRAQARPQQKRTPPLYPEAPPDTINRKRSPKSFRIKASKARTSSGLNDSNESRVTLRVE